MFNWIWYKYGVFDRAQDGETLGGVWTTGRRRKSRKGGKGKATRLEIYLIALRDTLPRLQEASWWEWEDGFAPFFWKWPVGYLFKAQDGVSPWIKEDQPIWMRP